MPISDADSPLTEESAGLTFVERVVSYSGDGRHMLICERSFIKRTVWNVCDTAAGNETLKRYTQTDFDGMQALRREWCERHACEFAPFKDNSR